MAAVPIGVGVRADTAPASLEATVAIAVLSLGAAAVHFAVIPEHVAEWLPFGVFFAGLAWFQSLWAVGYLVHPSTRLTLGGAAVNVATIALWVVSRTVGLPIGPEPWMPEHVGGPDLLSTSLEMVLVIGLLAPGLLAPGLPARGLLAAMPPLGRDASARVWRVLARHRAAWLAATGAVVVVATTVVLATSI